MVNGLASSLWRFYHKLWQDLRSGPTSVAKEFDLGRPSSVLWFMLSLTAVRVPRLGASRRKMYNV